MGKGGAAWWILWLREHGYCGSGSMNVEQKGKILGTCKECCFRETVSCTVTCDYEDAGCAATPAVECFSHTTSRKVAGPSCFKHYLRINWEYASFMKPRNNLGRGTRE